MVNDFLKGAPREIDRADVLGELLHRFEQDDPNNAVAWVLDTLTELDILKFRAPTDGPAEDLIGTYRREDHEDGFSIWQAMLDRSDSRFWLCVYSTAAGNRLVKATDADMVGARVVGAVPGSPADEVTVTGEDIDRWATEDDDREPQVPPFKVGDWVRNRRTGAVLQVASDLANCSPRFYQLTDSPLPRESRVFRSDGPEPPEDVKALEWLDIKEPDQYLYLIRSGRGWLWSRMANRLAPDHRATPNRWPDAVSSIDGRFREVFPA